MRKWLWIISLKNTCCKTSNRQLSTHKEENIFLTEFIPFILHWHCNLPTKVSFTILNMTKDRNINFVCLKFNMFNSVGVSVPFLRLWIWQERQTPLKLKVLVIFSVEENDLIAGMCFGGLIMRPVTSPDRDTNLSCSMVQILCQNMV